MDDRELLRRLHDWFLEAAPEHYAGCGLYFDVNERLAAAPEPLRVGREDVAKAISPEYAPPWPRADREFLSVVWAETLNSAERVLALIEPSAGGGDR